MINNKIAVDFLIGKPRSSATSRLRGLFFFEELRKFGIANNYFIPKYEISYGSKFGATRVFNKFIYTDSINNDYGFCKLIHKLIKSESSHIYLVKTIYDLKLLFVISFLKIFSNKKIIFDFDDTIYFKKNKKYISIFLTKISSLVVVENSVLREWAIKYNSNILILDTVVPFKIYSKYRKKEFNNHSILKLCWVGHSINHYENLRIISQVLDLLIKKEFNFKFYLLGGQHLKNIRDLFKKFDKKYYEIIDDHDWLNIESNPIFLSKMDVGLAPVISSPKFIGGGSLKIIEYMSCGLPVIATSTENNKLRVQNYINGFLVDNLSDWVRSITILKDGDLRSKMSKNSLDLSFNKFSTENNAKTLVEFLKN